MEPLKMFEKIVEHDWHISWSLAGCWLVKTGPELSDQLSFDDDEHEKAMLIAAAPRMFRLISELAEISRPGKSEHAINSLAEALGDDAWALVSALNQALEKRMCHCNYNGRN